MNIVLVVYIIGWLCTSLFCAWWFDKERREEPIDDDLMVAISVICACWPISAAVFILTQALGLIIHARIAKKQR